MNYLTFYIVIFIICFALLHFFKPSMIYHPDGSLRQFGIGHRKRTVVPLWLVVILSAIFSYSVALYLTP